MSLRPTGELWALRIICAAFDLAFRLCLRFGLLGWSLAVMEEGLPYRFERSALELQLQEAVMAAMVQAFEDFGRACAALAEVLASDEFTDFCAEETP